MARRRAASTSGTYPATAVRRLRGKRRARPAGRGVLALPAHAAARAVRGGERRLGGTLLEPGSGAGCRLYELALDTGREHALPVPAPRGVSDTTPSMWHGEVAFARHSPRHGAVWQVLLFSPRSPHWLLTLPHGAVPPCPHGGCGDEPPSGEVEALSFRAGTVAFVWSPQGPGLLGEEAWEDRVDRVSTRSGQLVGTQLGIESCTESGAAFEQAFPLTPLAGSLTLFPYYERGDCYRTFATGLAAVRGDALFHATLQRPLWGLASDGGSYYGIVARPGVPGLEDAKCTSASPCAIEALALPRLRRTTARPAHPFL